MQELYLQMRPPPTPFVQRQQQPLANFLNKAMSEKSVFIFLSSFLSNFSFVQNLKHAFNIVNFCYTKQRRELYVYKC